MDDEWLTTAEIMELLGWTHRGSVARVAHREGWRVQASELLPRHKFRFHRDDVQTYLLHRKRTALISKWFVDKRGRGVKGLVRDMRYDTTCPVCKKYAVYEPLTTLEDALSFADDADKVARHRKTRCVGGHEVSP